MGDKTIAQWLLDLCLAQKNLRRGDEEDEEEEEKSLNLREILEMYVEIMLGKKDNQLQNSYLDLVQVISPNELHPHLEDCLKLS
mmetsp:Transcript_11767/g.19849  ORF Transcript_11767/g.19849 Transcript_11767/m.19849 type:complete len:84 (+) Transcript_11767:92-343(+)